MVDDDDGLVVVVVVDDVLVVVVVAAGPVDTARLTAVFGGTCAPAPGFWSITVPAG